MLTDAILRALKPKEKLYRKADGGGLCIEIAPLGAKPSKLWRYRYRYGGRALMMGLGAYPVVTLAAARDKRVDARRLLEAGINPIDRRRNDTDALKRKVRGKFAVVAKEWLELKKKSVGSVTARKLDLIVEGDLIPALRKYYIQDLATKDCTQVLRDIAKRAPSLATKARQYLNEMVDYAIKEGLRDEGKLLSLKGVIPKYKKGHIPAITRPKDIGPLLRAIDAYNSPITRAALQLTSLTAMRPGIVASAESEHFDLKNSEWHVPGALMKTEHDHIVPLPRQAIEILKAVKAEIGETTYVFPSPAQQKTPHLHRDALSKALREMGFQGKHATHGFRGMLRTVGRERVGIDIDVLEAQLAHAKKDEIEKAYDRTKFDEERRKVMQAWADYLDERRLDKDE